MKDIWQLPQNLLGAAVSVSPAISTRIPYLGKSVCFWPSTMGMSLGRYIFLPEEILPESADALSTVPMFRHEYGHTIQSAFLGPLYLVVVGLPSLVWANLPCLKRLRKKRDISYYDFPIERDATNRGEKFFGLPAPSGMCGK